MMDGRWTMDDGYVVSLKAVSFGCCRHSFSFHMSDDCRSFEGAWSEVVVETEASN